ncbi:MAG TPA: alpha/beta hydrolase [Dermatophilaceae bacterium]|nr:alpha/beta hydrolase [Dermatophilaceae bacterium]
MTGPPPGPAPVVTGGRTVVSVAELVGLAGSVLRWQERLAESTETVRRAADGMAQRLTAARSVAATLRLVDAAARLVALTRTEAAATGGRLTGLAVGIRLAAQAYATTEEVNRRSWELTDGLFGRLAAGVARAYPQREVRIGDPETLPARPPPEGLAGLLTLLEAPGASAGRVDVWQLVPAGAFHPGTVAVALPGTSDWAPPWAAGDAPDIRTLGASLDLIGRRASAEVAALPDALASAGVSAGTRLVLVGHSLGGLTATVAAGDPRLRERYLVTHVVTAGSPVGGLALPPGVRGLSLEHRADLVPMLDGHANPGGSGRLTIRFGAERDGPFDDPLARASRSHSLAEYRNAATWADCAVDPDLADLRSSLTAVGLGSQPVGGASLGRRVVLELGEHRAPAQ